MRKNLWNFSQDSIFDLLPNTCLLLIFLPVLFLTLARVLCRLAVAVFFLDYNGGDDADVDDRILANKYKLYILFEVHTVDIIKWMWQLAWWTRE